MQRKTKRWWWGAVVVAVLLCAGLSALAANPNGGQPSAGAKHAKGQAPASLGTKMSPAMTNIMDQLKAKGMTHRDILKAPKTRFKAPAMSMFVDTVTKLGVDVPASVKKNPESLCDYYGAWYAGPSMASNTNGTSVIWGGGQSIYFASASDPTNPARMDLGDYPVRVYYQGNIAVVMCTYYVLSFDVTDPVSPSLIGYNVAGIATNFTGFAITADQKYIVGTFYGDWVVVFDIEMNYLGDADMETLYGPTYPWVFIPLLTDIICPETPGSVVIISDWDNYLIHFVDLSNFECAGMTYLGFVDDDLAGYQDCGQLMYQEPYLYTVYQPWYNYNPFVMNNCPDQAWYVDVFSVPDITHPSIYLPVKYLDNTNGDDIVSIKAGGDGKVVMGMYTGRVAVWDEQIITSLGFGVLGKYGYPDGWCMATAPEWEFFTLDMGYAPGAGVTANWANGANFFAAPSMVQTGNFQTGDLVGQPAVQGNIMYVPEFAAGLAIVDGSDPTSPVTLGWLPPTNLDVIDLAAVSGSTLYVAKKEYTDHTKVYAADVSNPAAPTYLSTSSTAFDINPVGGPSYGTVILSLAAYGPICWIGTDTSLVGVDFSNPAAPSVEASFVTVLPAYGMSVFTLPAFPVSTFLAVAEGSGIQIFDITPPLAVPVCPTPYFFVNQIGIGAGSMATQVFATGGFLIYNDTVNGLIGSIQLTAQLANACGANEILMALSDTLDVTPPMNPQPYNIAYAGTVGGRVVGAMGDGYYGISTFDMTDPTNLMFLNTPPQVVPNYSWFVSRVLAFCNNAVYYGMGYGGLSNYVLEPGFIAPTVNSVTVSPAIGNFLTGTVTVTVSVTASDSAITEVDLSFEGEDFAVLPTNVPAGTSKTLTYTWNTSTWRYVCGADVITATAWDSGCNYGVGATALTYSINLAPTIAITGYNQPIPVGLVCGPDPGDWVVCDKLTFNACATDGPCNVPNGISQMSLYIDGKEPANFVTYINNPTCPPGWDISIDTTTLSDGPHVAWVSATDNQGLTGWKSTPTFTVHNNGPITTVVDPVAGDVVSGVGIRVAATATSMGSNVPIYKVVFYLDAGTPQAITLGTAYPPADADGEYAITWDSTPTGTNTPYGDHVITATGWDWDGITCKMSSPSPLVSFRLVSYTPMAVTASATPTSGNKPLSVAFSANVTGGAAPFYYAWNFGDGGSGNNAATSHIYTTVGTFTWTVTVTDGMLNQATASGSVTVNDPVVPPLVSAVTKVNSPEVPNFRLRIYGTNFHPNCTVRINGVAVTTTWKNSGLVVAKKGGALKSMVPKGVTVQISVKNNDDGGTSTDFPYTR